MNNCKGTILLVGDDKDDSSSALHILVKHGYEIRCIAEPKEALSISEIVPFDVAIFFLQYDDAIELLSKLKLHQPLAKFILRVEDQTKTRTALANSDGAYEVITPATSPDLILHTVERAMDQSLFSDTQDGLREIDVEQRDEHSIIGNSEPFQKVLRTIQQTAPTKATILLSGENGTGKEVLAKRIHDLSPRKGKPFVQVNCSALTETLLESELFGHEKGAFTGAHAVRNGRFEIANHGTLFLDEIGDVSLTVQVKLLRFLQEREFERVGSNTTLKSDVRIIAATNQDLAAKIRNGMFREDFYYRLRIIEVVLPPLRERKEDIPLFISYFMTLCARNHQREIPRISQSAKDMLLAYSWPGNIRQLENSIERVVILTPPGEEITENSFPLSLREPCNGNDRLHGSAKNKMSIPFELSLNEIEEIVLQKTLKYCDDDKQKTALMLGLSERTLYRKLSESRKRQKKIHANQVE